MKFRPIRIIHFCTFAAIMVCAGGSNASSDSGEPGVLVGQGTLSVLFWDIYDARLYSDSGFYRPDQGFRLVIDYRRAVSADDIVSHSIDEIERVTLLSKDKVEDWRSVLAGIFKDVQPSDRLVGVFDPETGASFYLNDDWIGSLSDLILARAFFDIWLSETTSRPELRANLLGLSQ